MAAAKNLKMNSFWFKTSKFVFSRGESKFWGESTERDIFSGIGRENEQIFG